MVQMPHESTMIESEEVKFQADEERMVQSRTRSRSMVVEAGSSSVTATAFRKSKALSLVAETPLSITHHHDDDDDDDAIVSQVAYA